jgi:sugar phosphate isomerase/epimerase
MKVGVLTLLFGEQPLEQMLDYLCSLKVQAVEFGTGAYVRAPNFPIEELLSSDAKVSWLRHVVQSRNLEISALSCHGNPLHPNPRIAKAHHAVFLSTCILARKLGVSQVNTLSGCPGSDPQAQLPSWIVSPLFPEDFSRAWEWQWNERVIPYWQDAVKVAEENGVRIGIEMAPNCVVFNVNTLLRLRHAVGAVVGANLDPSHLFWQGMEICAVIRALGDAIYHFHAKDSAINPYVAALDGVLDPKPLTDELNRSWIFRTVGYGHDELAWNNIISTLRTVGYDSVLSIEHEDSLMDADEGLRKAISFLSRGLIQAPPGRAYWAE